MARIFIHPAEGRRRPAREEIAILAVAVLALLILAALGHHSLHALRQQLAQLSAGSGPFMLCLLLLNVAFTLYGWRKYRNSRREVAERTAAEQRAQRLAATDPLTGLLNRRSFGAAGNALVRAAEGRQRAAAVLMVDLDGFRTINDVHGHLTGDNLLRRAAEIIRSTLPPEAVCARLGGDEFAAAFSFDPAAPDAAAAAARVILDRLGAPADLAGVPVHSSASIGIARADQDRAGIEALLRRADIAMQAARKQGRGRLAWFDTCMERSLRERSSIAAGLRDGIASGAFAPVFESQVDLSSGALHGFEVLAHWRRPHGKSVPPAEFIGVAEECGLIDELSIRVMRQAFEEARSWNSSLILSVNIPPAQLKDPWFAQKMVKLLVETGFPADRLEIEITESALLDNLGLVQSIVGSLKNQGVRIALDDFGTGYSSLAHLRALPFDRLKIDRSLVVSLDSDPESAAIVNAISRLAESLNLALTAQGIADPRIEARLRSMGRHQGQGQLYGPRMAGAEVRKLLAEQGLLPPRRSFGREAPAPCPMRAAK